MLDGSTCARQNPVISAGPDRWRCGGGLSRHAVSRVPVTSAPTIGYTRGSGQARLGTPATRCASEFNRLTAPKTPPNMKSTSFQKQQQLEFQNHSWRWSHWSSTAVSQPSAGAFMTVYVAAPNGRCHGSGQNRTPLKLATKTTRLMAKGGGMMGSATLEACSSTRGAVAARLRALRHELFPWPLLESPGVP